MIYLIWAPPRQGKTYYATKMLLKSMSRGLHKKHFSNYPVKHPTKGYTLKWESEYSGVGITDSLIVIDEAYRDFNSRDYKKFSADDHLFFATNGHNGNDIVLIAHDPNRIDTVIREMANEFVFVKKYALPLLRRPLFFKAEFYPDVLSLSQRHMYKNAAYGVEYYMFDKDTAKAYDTHFFRVEGEPEIEFENWGDMIGYVHEHIEKTFKWAVSQLATFAFFKYFILQIFNPFLYFSIPVFFYRAFKYLIKYKSFDFYYKGFDNRKDEIAQGTSTALTE